MSGQCSPFRCSSRSRGTRGGGTSLPRKRGHPQRGSVETEARDSGNAIIEFVFVALVIMVPLVYLLVAVATVQRAQVAVANAARDAGRAYVTAQGGAEADTRVDAASRLALANAGLDPAAPRFVPAGASCDADSITPRLIPGEVFTVCVTRRVDLPAIPSIVQGRGITVTGRYTVHVDDYADVGAAS